jgi:hypothetical protein
MGVAGAGETVGVSGVAADAPGSGAAVAGIGIRDLTGAGWEPAAGETAEISGVAADAPGCGAAVAGTDGWDSTGAGWESVAGEPLELHAEDTANTRIANKVSGMTFILCMCCKRRQRRRELSSSTWQL